MRKRYLVHLYGNVLRFYEAQGWSEDLVRSMLSTGDIRKHRDFYHLSFTEVSAFDEERLKDLTDAISEHGRLLDEIRTERAIKYYSSTNVYSYGENFNRKK